MNATDLRLKREPDDHLLQMVAWYSARIARRMCKCHLLERTEMVSSNLAATRHLAPGSIPEGVALDPGPNDLTVGACA